MKMNRSLGIVSTLFIAAACAACSGGDDSASGEPAPSADQAGGDHANVVLEIQAGSSAIVRRTSGGTIMVSVEGSAAANATLDIEGLPPGIAATVGQGRIDLSFAGEPAFGEYPIKIRAKSAGEVRELALALVVADDAGVLDKTFATNGVLAGVASIRAQRMALDEQGRSLATGVDGAVKGWVTRHTGEGLLDTTFGGTGTVSVSYDPVEQTLPVTVATKGHDVFVGGFRGTLLSATPCIAKLDDAGKPAPGFGKDGVACFVAPQIGTFGAVAEMLPLDDGSMLVLAMGGTLEHQDVVVLKVTANGELDGSFGLGGVARWTAPTSDGFGNLVVDAEGRVLASGTSYDELTKKSWGFVLRLTKSGQPDPWFGKAGMATIERAATQSAVHGMTIGSKGEIFLAGSEEHSPAIFALEPEKGAVLGSFANGGARLYPELGSGRFTTIAWDEGKLLLGGSLGSDEAANASLMRVASSDGALDSTFGQAGVATLPFGSSTESVLMAPSSRAAVLVPTQSSYVIARVWR